MALKRKIPHDIDHEIRVKLKKNKDVKAQRRLIAINMYRQPRRKHPKAADAEEQKRQKKLKSSWTREEHII